MHTVTSSSWRGRRTAQCSCGVRFGNVALDGVHNENSGRMVRHIHETGGRLVQK